MEHQLINWLDGTFAWATFIPNPAVRCKPAEGRHAPLVRNDNRWSINFDLNLTTYEAAQLFGGGN